MKIKNKILLSGLIIAILPVTIVSFSISNIATSQSREALESAAKERLLSTRELTKEHIESYFKIIQGQIKSLSENKMVIDAANGFKVCNSVGFGSFMGNREQELVKEREQMGNYYNNIFTNAYRARNGGENIDINHIISALSNSTIEHQYRFLQKNTFPLGEKYKLSDLKDSSVYNHQHKKYHPSFRDYMQTFGFYDIFIADPDSGKITYSVYKEIDFFTSIKDGPFAQTGIGKVFRLANQASSSDYTIMSDFSPYLPSYNDQAAFIASPIFDGDKKVGILIFQLSIDQINDVLTHHKKWTDVGLGQSGETYIVAKDKKARSVNRLLVEDQQGYFDKMQESGMSVREIKAIQTKSSNIGLQSFDTDGVNHALSGQSSFSTITGYLGNKVLSAYTPLEIKGVNWVLLAEISAKEAFAPIEALNHSILKTVLILFVIITLLVTVLSIWFSGTIANPIVRLSKILVHVGDDADLSLRADIDSKDEIGSAASAFNVMMDKMSESIQHVSAASMQLSTTAEQTAAITESMNQTLEEQNQQTSQVSSKILQMNATVNEVAEHTTEAANAATEVNSEVEKGQSAMLETIDVIKKLSDDIDGTAGLIEEIEKNSTDIATILEVIQGIAEQTNLLALNAAIEAARAGEQGRGFAVVADEVRTLASRTQDSAHEINQTIEKLHQASHRGVESMGLSQNRAKEAVAHAKETGDTLNIVVAEVTKIRDMSSQIAITTESQSSVAGEISANISQIERMTEQNVTGAQETAKANEEISSLAHKLQQQVDSFKL
ncbi:MAG: methyl-accepting chemotaxis protein [gamma proteobacterium symbiont of Taylorina sp.]|nr:methyl-accepting chemotaxis protein [gamma proteobacterium symbiont of Taylorina sp.]